MASDPKIEFLSPAGVERTARLARLALEPGEFARLVPQLRSILLHIERIAEIPEADLPAPEAPPETTLRPDRAVAGDGKRELERNSGVIVHGHIPVPRVVDASR